MNETQRTSHYWTVQLTSRPSGMISHDRTMNEEDRQSPVLLASHWVFHRVSSNIVFNDIWKSTYNSISVNLVWCLYQKPRCYRPTSSWCPPPPRCYRPTSSCFSHHTQTHSFYHVTSVVSFTVKN